MHQDSQCERFHGPLHARSACFLLSLKSLVETGNDVFSRGPQVLRDLRDDRFVVDIFRALADPSRRLLLESSKRP